MVNKLDSFFELTRPMTLVLIVLSQGARYPYAIMLEIPRVTNGDYCLGAGSLYRSIRQMEAYGLLKEAPELFHPEIDDKRRRYYRITELGLQALTTELSRMDKLIQKSKILGIYEENE